MYIHTHLDQENLMSGAVDLEMYDIKHFVSLLITYHIVLLLLPGLHPRVTSRGLRRINCWVLNVPCGSHPGPDSS